jgi:hypothetical protein
MRNRSAALFTLAAIVAAACSGDTLLDPAGQPAATTAGSTDSASRDSTRSDTTRADTTRTTPRPPGTPADTARPVATSGTVSGRVLGGTYNPNGTGSDTLQFSPIAGTTVKLFHNRLIDGVATSVLISQMVTGTDGAYTFGPVPGGYYLLRAYPPDGSGFGESLSYLPLTQAQVSMNIYVWRRPPGSTTPPTGSTPADSTRRP